MPIETFDFNNARGSRLSGKIEAPEVTPRGWGGLGNSDGDLPKRPFPPMSATLSWPHPPWARPAIRKLDRS